MSDRTNGVVFAADEDVAVEFFSDLEPTTFLRLTQLDENDLWGIYAEGWPGDREVLDEIARLASVAVGVSYRVCYDGAVGPLDSLFENGERTQSMDPDDQCTQPWQGNVCKVFGRHSNIDDTIEAAFKWGGNTDWVLEIVPRPS